MRCARAAQTHRRVHEGGDAGRAAALHVSGARALHAEPEPRARADDHRCHRRRRFGCAARAVPVRAALAVLVVSDGHEHRARAHGGTRDNLSARERRSPRHVGRVVARGGVRVGRRREARHSGNAAARDGGVGVRDRHAAQRLARQHGARRAGHHFPVRVALVHGTCSRVVLIFVFCTHCTHSTHLLMRISLLCDSIILVLAGTARPLDRRQHPRRAAAWRRQPDRRAHDAARRHDDHLVHRHSDGHRVLVAEGPAAVPVHWRRVRLLIRL